MSQPNPEGRVEVILLRRGGVLGEVRTVSSRPQLAQRLLGGGRPERAVQLAGMLFSVCGRAQRVASETAVEAARGLTPSRDTRVRRELEVLAETAREHLWQFLVRGPELIDQTPDASALRGLRQVPLDAARLAALLEGLLGERVLGESTEAWLGRDPHVLEEWIAGMSTPAARLLRLACTAGEGVGCRTRLLPPLSALDEADARGLARRALQEPAWCVHPDWLGEPAETGALARRAGEPPVSSWIAAHGRGVAARLLARLAELAGMPRRLTEGGYTVVRGWPLGGGVGIAGVETARGLLLHVVRLEDDRVTDYRILAPTEWNFHPAGALAQALAVLPADGLLETRARLLILSLDPCVEFGLEVRDA